MGPTGLHPTGLYTLQLPNLKTEERAQGQWQRHFCFIGWRESHIPEASSWSNTPLCTHEMASREQRPAPHCARTRWQAGNSDQHYYLNDGEPTSLTSPALAADSLPLMLP